MCFPHVWSMGQLRAHCVTVWPNQKVSALLDSKCSQLKPNTRVKQLSLLTTSDHYCIRGLSWMCGQCIDYEKTDLTLWPEGERLSCSSTVAVRQGLEARIPNIQSEFPFWQCRRCRSAMCGSNPHLMGQQNRGLTPRTAWSSVQGRKLTLMCNICGRVAQVHGGVSYVCGRSVCHMQQYQRERERSNMYEGERSHPHILNEESLIYFKCA